MKKATLISTILIFALIVQTGCRKTSDQVDDPNETAPQTKQPITQKPQALSEDIVIRPGVGAGKVRLGMTVGQMKDALGDPDVDATGISWMYNSLGIEVVAKDKQTVSAISLGNPNNLPTGPAQTLQKACKFKTAEGTGIGSTTDEVIAALGQPTSQTEKRLAYKDKKMFIGLRDGKVTGFWLQK